MNSLAPRGDALRLGIASGLWAWEKDLRDYQKDPGTWVPLTLDGSGRLFRAFGVHDVPTVILLDSEGRINRELGPEDSDLEGALREMISSPRTL